MSVHVLISKNKRTFICTFFIKTSNFGRFWFFFFRVAARRCERAEDFLANPRTCAIPLTHCARLRPSPIFSLLVCKGWSNAEGICIRDREHMPLAHPAPAGHLLLNALPSARARGTEEEQPRTSILSGLRKHKLLGSRLSSKRRLLLQVPLLFLKRSLGGSDPVADLRGPPMHPMVSQD